MDTVRAPWEVSRDELLPAPSTAARIRAGLLRFVGRQRWIPRGKTRLLYSLWHPDSGRSYPFEVDFFGMRYRGNLADLGDWFVYVYGASSYEELSLLEALTRELRKRKQAITFFDVGGNVGQHSLFMSQHADQVIAFEPFPPLQRMFREKMDLNQRNNVRLLPYALGDADLIRPFYPGGGTKSGVGTFLPDQGEAYQERIGIETRRGDSLFSDLNLPPIDLMKIDVEGYEPLVFRGLAGRIHRDRPPILMELNDRSRAGFGSEQGFRETFWEGAVFAEVSTLKPGCPYQLRPFRYEKSIECLVVPPEMASFVLDQIRSEAHVVRGSDNAQS